MNLDSWWIVPLSLSKLLLYKRYANDCFLIFSSEEHSNQFLNYVNSQHSNIQVTMGGETEGCLSFLDVMVKHVSGGF